MVGEEPQPPSVAAPAQRRPNLGRATSTGLEEEEKPKKKPESPKPPTPPPPPKELTKEEKLEKRKIEVLPPLSAVLPYLLGIWLPGYEMRW